MKEERKEGLRDLTIEEVQATVESLGLAMSPEEAVEVTHYVNALRDAMLPWDDIDLNSVPMRVPFFVGKEDDDV